MKNALLSQEERATPILSLCHGVFTDEFIFTCRLYFPAKKGNKLSTLLVIGHRGSASLRESDIREKFKSKNKFV